MDAVEYLKKKAKVTNYCNGCHNCPIKKAADEVGMLCEIFEYEEPEKAVEIVEKWAAEHPMKTRQSEFLEMFPRVNMSRNGVIMINPCMVDGEVSHNEICSQISCNDCRREYWLAEVE